MDNEIFITARQSTGVIVLGVGSYRNRRRVYLTNSDALNLAYCLMSLGKGGDTQGVEQFPRGK